jgi:hypothetical protein
MKPVILTIVKLLIIFCIFEFIIMIPLKPAAKLYLTGGTATKIIAAVMGIVGAVVWLVFTWWLLGWAERKLFY